MISHYQFPFYIFLHFTIDFSQSILKAEELQRKPRIQLELEDTREYDSEMTETMSIDKESSRYSSYLSSGESEYTEMTEASTSDAKSSHQVYL